MERYYHIGGTDICIIGNDEEISRKDGHLDSFRTKETKNCHRYYFSTVDELDGPTGKCLSGEGSNFIFQDQDKQICYIGVVKNDTAKAYIRTETVQDKTIVQVKRSRLTKGITSKIILRSLGIENLTENAGGFILHASFINHNEKAILFTAPSGTGKSTQADLWKLHRHSDIINGDRAIVRVRGDKVEACGLPFSGSSEYCRNAILPIAAIVYLEQAPETQIRPLKGIQAFRKIWEQITISSWNRDAVEKISERLTFVLKNVPVYQLSCTPDESAILALEKVLNQKP